MLLVPSENWSKLVKSFNNYFTTIKELYDTKVLFILVHNRIFKKRTMKQIKISMYFKKLLDNQ